MENLDYSPGTCPGRLRRPSPCLLRSKQRAAFSPRVRHRPSKRSRMRRSPSSGHRAGVAPATAYTYFASREHLVTEVFWRKLSALPEPRIDRRRCAADRVTAAIADIMQLTMEQPQLTSAITVAMMADDPDVAHLRDRVGLAIHQRFVLALGEHADSAVIRALDLAMAGALVRAGTGHLTYQEVPERIAEVAALLLEKRP
jgi:AcrR family transcriptional regulator